MSSPSRSDPSDPARADLTLDLERPIPATWMLVALLVLVHVASALVAWRAGGDLVDPLLFARSERLRVAVGGQEAVAVARGEIWRLATSVLLHADALHLALNAIAVGALGRVLEPWVGGLRVCAWFLAGGLAGSVASQLAGVQQSDGASGGAFALLGAAVVLGWRWRARLDPADRRLLGPVLGGLLVLNLVLSFLIPAIDAAGHVGGLVAGLVMVWLPTSAEVVRLEAILVGGFGVACAYGWLWG